MTPYYSRQSMNVRENQPVLTRRGGYLHSTAEPGPDAARRLEDQGYVILSGALDRETTDELRADLDRVWAEYPPDERRVGMADGFWNEFRYEILNRSEVAQRVAGDRTILDAIEPLIGEDCHVIANTAWRNPPSGQTTHGGGRWHIDAGPQVPRPEGTIWPEEIPYPIFVVACHILLAPMPPESGPTGVIRYSHKSGQAPPRNRVDDVDLTCNGEGAVPLVADTGDVALFVSDAWHRRLPTQAGDPGRDFLQIHYGRRDIAQRLRPTDEVNQLSREAVERAENDRERTLVGLHPRFFYDG